MKSNHGPVFKILRGRFFLVDLVFFIVIMTSRFFKRSLDVLRSQTKTRSLFIFGD